MLLLFSSQEEKKNRKINNLCFSTDIPGTFREKDRESWRFLSTKNSQGCICCYCSHISQGQLLWEEVALRSDPQWVSWGKGGSSPFLPKRIHQTSSRCFPNSKNHMFQICIRLFSQKAEPIAISFCLNNPFCFLLTICMCMHKTKASDWHIKNAGLNQTNGIV